MNELHVSMLGGFSIRAGEHQITDSDNRSKKVWLLLAYLICHENRAVSSKELIDLLWGDDPSSNHPENALKITLHRARTLLDQLWSSAGRQLIVYRDNGYIWSSDFSLALDTDIFDRLCHPASDSDDDILTSYLEALSLYRGEFLEKLSSEVWVIPIATHFHNLYIQTVLNTVPLLISKQAYQQAEELCRTAIARDPYHEALYRQYMQLLSAKGDPSGVIAVYEELSQKLFTSFGIHPCEETRAVYRSVTHALTDHSLPMDVVFAQLQEPDAAAGALECEYDDFKILCHAETRSILRSGKATHIALLSVVGSPDKPLSKRSLTCAMDNLGTQIRMNLRRGDAFSRCSISQFVLMLPQANYENSCMVCRRVIGAFTRKYPHSPAAIQFIVQPLGQNALDL